MVAYGAECVYWDQVLLSNVKLQLKLEAAEQNSLVVGMLLELDRAWTEQLLSDDTALQVAVIRATEEYHKEKHPKLLAPGDSVSDAVYQEVYICYIRKMHHESQVQQTS